MNRSAKIYQLTVEDISKVVGKIKEIKSDICVMVDNCYGEFIQKIEPTQVGADIIVGSLIKNPGISILPSFNSICL